LPHKKNKKAVERGFERIPKIPKALAIDFYLSRIGNKDLGFKNPNPSKHPPHSYSIKRSPI
jgi:hypothetical protein